MVVDQEEIVRLTETYGGTWGINHTRRLLILISIIGEGLSYDAEIVWLAAHLHDWGGYAPWAQTDVDHAQRSKQVAAEFLAERGLPEEPRTRVLECIEQHHSGGPNRTLESILLSDADALDFLGVVGVLRDFAKNTKDMRKAFETSRKRRAKLPDTLRLPRSKELAAKRIGQMDSLYAQFEEDSFGCF